MRIESTEAFVLPSERVESLTVTQGVQRGSTNQSGNVTKLSDNTVINAIEEANKAIITAGRQLEFSIHEKTKAIMVKVIDTDTKEVVREIPPEKILDMVASILEMAGILVDERR